MSRGVARARTAFVWVGLVVPLAIIAVAAIVMATWLPSLPDPTAIHWSGAGPDGFGPAWTHLALLVGVGGGLVTLFAVLVLSGRASRARAAERGDDRAPDGEGAQWPPTIRFLGGVNLGVAGMMSFVGLVTVGMQRGLEDAADAPEIGPWTLAGFALLAALTAIGWLLQPKVAPPTTGRAAAPLPLAESEQAVWVGTATMARSGQVVLGLCLLSIVAATILMLAQGADGWWISGLLVVALTLLVAGAMVFRIRITDAGITVRSVLGWPRVAIPVQEIEAVRAVRVDPFGEFGGWGLRYALGGRYGVVLRRGDGIAVTRTDGRTFVVTVDDAATAASVLAAASARS